MPDDGTRRLAADPVGPLFLRLAIPAVLGQLAVLVNNVVDRMWVGHIPHDGMLSLGAVGLSLPIHHVFLALILMLAAGMTPHVSILLGQGDRERARRASGSCFGLGILVSLVSSAVLLVFADGLLLSFGAGEDSLPFARSYLRTLAWGMPFSNLLLMLTMWLNAQGYVADGVRLNLLNVGVNALMDPVLIYLAGWGVTGAAVATNLGAVVALVCGVRLVRRESRLVRFGARDLLPRWGLCRKPLALGLSTLLNVALESIALLVFNAALQRFGGDLAVSAMSLFGIPLLVLMNLCLGLSNGAQPIVSYNYGAGRPERVAAANRNLILASFACSFVLWAVVMALHAQVWRCFTGDAGLVAYAASKTRLFFAVALFGGIQYAHIYIIKFLGSVKMSLFLGVLKRLVLLIPLILVLPRVLGGDAVSAVLLASPLSEGAAFLVTAVCYLLIMRTVWRKGAQ